MRNDTASICPLRRLLALFVGTFFSLIPLSVSGQGNSQTPLPAVSQNDQNPLLDPMRQVTEIGSDFVTLQWFTQQPCETRVQIREGNLPIAVWRPDDKKRDLWADSKAVKVINGPPGTRTFHTLRIIKLSRGKRYFYRIFDPSVSPTPQEKAWGAVPPYRREWAVSTTAGKGKRTLLRIPVKVLLMPNVLNVTSARKPDGSFIAVPAKLTLTELTRIKDEYATAARFFFVNSGCRYWVDFQFFVDDRWQRWGPEPQNLPAEYSGWPLCRSYAGVDFKDPGGGAFTILDTTDIARNNTTAVFEEIPFAGQIEQAFPRRFNERSGQWEFYDSGGGTFGLDSFPLGIPGRSQFLGGGDTAWLAAHEFHHQMEAQGAFSFSNREDDRIVFNHPTPRRFPDNAWNTAGRHGDHWDVLAFWDRTITDAQWLRIYFGETVTTKDDDNDGVPDDDPRLPFDEKRFGSDRKKWATDGRIRDLDKLLLSTFAPAPLQKTLRKPPMQAILPDPRNPDSDGDGLPDDRDPYPLYPYAPFVWPLTVRVDGDDTEWTNLPVAGQMDKGGIVLTFRQAHDDDGYYGLITIRGPYKRVRIMLDGEGAGLQGSDSVAGFQATALGSLPPDIRPLRATTGLEVKTGTATNGDTIVEFVLPNRGAGKWFWERGGREVGVSLEVSDRNDTVYSVYEPYRLFYARMLETTGLPLLPPNPPAELTTGTARTVLLPTDPILQLSGKGWQKDGNVLRHSGEDESLILLNVGTPVTEFDFWVRFEATQDGILAAFTPETTAQERGAVQDYVAFVGGYKNTVTRLRLFGRETGESDATLTPGEHTMQLTRRNGEIWCLFDGKPILFARDPHPDRKISHLSIIGGYNGAQVIKELRVRN